MTDEPTNADRNVGSMLLQCALAVALILAIGGLVYIADSRSQTNTLLHSNGGISGQLRVTYELIVSKTASSEEAIGSTIDASRIDYFASYVLVTTKNKATFLWPIDRLKKFEVVRVD